jgi:hypothetical protein
VIWLLRAFASVKSRAQQRQVSSIPRLHINLTVQALHRPHKLGRPNKSCSPSFLMGHRDTRTNRAWRLNARSSSYLETPVHCTGTTCIREIKYVIFYLVHCGPTVITFSVVFTAKDCKRNPGSTLVHSWLHSRDIHLLGSVCAALSHSSANPCSIRSLPVHQMHCTIDGMRLCRRTQPPPP